MVVFAKPKPAAATLSGCQDVPCGVVHTESAFPMHPVSHGDHMCPEMLTQGALFSIDFNKKKKKVHADSAVSDTCHSPLSPPSYIGVHIAGVTWKLYTDVQVCMHVDLTTTYFGCITI